MRCHITHHSVFMGNIEVPAPGARQPIKTSVGTYEFGANVIHDKVRWGSQITPAAVSCQIIP